MSGFNSIERSIARLLERFPVVKKIAKWIYARVVYLKEKENCTYKVVSPLTTYSESGKASFFGYYDKSPVNSTGMVLLCTTSQNTKKKPRADIPIELAVMEDEKIVLAIATHAYNWQQGCRAHWLNEDEFIFNDFDENMGKYIGRVFSVSKKREIKKLKFAVQDSFNNEYFIALNYQRIMALRPDYGYRNLPAKSLDQIEDLSCDGLWKVDLKTGDDKLLISIQQVCELDPTHNFSDAQHLFNHVSISPNGKRLIFMHRYFRGQRRFDRLLLLDMASEKLKLLADHDMISHCFWADNSTVLGYLRGPKNIDAYWLIDVETKTYSQLPNNALQGYGDGHPHVYNNWFVTDTYPNKSRMQQLLLCNWKTGDVKKLGEFYHGFEFNGESRCDLHPRFSLDGTKIFFDSVFTGQRQLYSIDIKL